MNTDADPAVYRVFTRTSFRRVKKTPAWPKGIEPGWGSKSVIARHKTWAQARDICTVWNANHEPGPLHRMAEFEHE